MLVTVDLGFLSLLLILVCSVVPVVGFLIRRKWRLSIARKEEIKRLLILAAEEAARAELDATASYSPVPVVRNNYQSNYQCAVCYCPTTTRCAQCKAVRYCSGKCQILHWRQGHKGECRPASITYSVVDDTSDSSQKAEREDQRGIYDERFETAHFESSATEPVLSIPIASTGVPIVKDDHVRANFIPEAEGRNSNSESSGTSFSGFSTPLTGGESSDDVSITESVSSDEHDGSDSRMYADTPVMHKSGSKEVEGTKPLSPKFASLVDAVDGFNKLSKLNQSKPSNNEGKSLCESSSGHSINATDENQPIRSGKISSGFWGKTHDTSVSNNGSEDDSAPSSLGGSRSSKLSDSESSLHFKFSLSGGNDNSLHTQSSEVKDAMINNALPSDLGTNESVNRAASKVRGSTSTSAKVYNHSYNASSGDSNVSKLNELKPIPSSSANQTSDTVVDVLGTNVAKVSRSPSTRSESSNLVVNNSVSTAHVSKSRLSPIASETHLASSASRNSDASAKLRKAENVQSDAMNSSQIARSPPNSINGLKSSMWKVVDQLRGPKSGRYSDKGLFPYDLFVMLYTSNKVEMRPCGLINCGNSCYANAVLQCLAFTPPLTAYFVQGLHSKACVNKGWCFTCEFENLISKAKDGKSVLSPAGVLSQLQNIGSQLGNGKEEDAHEFLRCAIDAMQSVCLKEASMNGVGSAEEETTIIGYTFGGYLRSKIKCMKCQYKSERQERMMDLTVEIEGDIGKLEDALKRFTGTEILDGDNKYQCTRFGSPLLKLLRVIFHTALRCKSYEKAKKKLTITEAPNVLTIALKRFQSGKFGKLNKSIRFPEILYLAPYMSATSDKSPIYRLYGVVVHLDVMNASFSGHYVCYVKSIQNKWFKIDDSMVTPVELEKVLTKGAYMLLYARCSPRAPRLIRNRITTPDPKNKGTPSRISIKDATSDSRSTSAHLSVLQNPSSVPADSADNVESFYLKFHRLQKILEQDSSSDSFSFTSSNSDEGSCSTDSNRDSTSTEDLSDYIFGSWNNNSWRTASDSDASSSSSSSPLYSRHSPLSDVIHGASCSPDTGRSHSHVHADSGVDNSYYFDRVSSGFKGVDPFLHSDKTIQRRKLISSSFRENDSVELGRVNPLNVVKSGVSFRRSVRERTS